MDQPCKHLFDLKYNLYYSAEGRVQDQTQTNLTYPNEGVVQDES